LKAVDLELARLAESRGWIPGERARAALSEADRCQALGLEKSVDEILVEGNHLTQEQARSLRDALGLSLRQPRIGDYELVRRVGVGGMGTVFEACHVRLKQRIALKVLLPKLSRDPEAKERLLKEARALARLSHPNLVHAIDAGQDGDRCYLAMEFVDGENLLQMLLREGPFSPRRVCEIARDVCRALAALEEKGLVHRDVKPANVLVDPAGRVRLADFGLMIQPGEANGAAEPVCGTPHYISPEQVQHRRELDIRSDLYALGATCYHLLAGEPPFTGKSTKEIVQGHLKKPPPPLSKLRKDVPSDLELLVLRWLSKAPEDRPASAIVACSEVEAVLHRIDARERLRRLLRRPPVIAAAVVAVVLLSAGGIALHRRAQHPPAAENPAAHSPRSDEDAAAPRNGALPTPAAKAPVAAQVPGEARLPPDVTSPPDATGPASVPSAEKDATAVDTQRPAPGALPPPPPPHPTPRSDSGAAGAIARRPGKAEAFAVGRLFSGLIEATEKSRRAVAELAQRWASDAARFEPRRKLAQSFHAAFAGIGPGDGPWSVVLRYDFADPAQLDDFRGRPGSWRVEDGALTGLAEPIGDPLLSVAWLSGPVLVEGALEVESPLLVGWGQLRVAPGRGEDARIWREADGEEVPILAAPSTPPGPWSVELGREFISVRIGGRDFHVDVPSSEGDAPQSSRLLLKIAAGRRLRRLDVTAELDPVWAAERARALEASGNGKGR